MPPGEHTFKPTVHSVEGAEPPSTYESRLKQISQTKFKGDLQNVNESPEQQADIGDTREFEYLESEVIVDEVDKAGP